MLSFPVQIWEIRLLLTHFLIFKVNVKGNIWFSHAKLFINRSNMLQVVKHRFSFTTCLGLLIPKKVGSKGLFITLARVSSKTLSVKS